MTRRVPLGRIRMPTAIRGAIAFAQLQKNPVCDQCCEEVPAARWSQHRDRFCSKVVASLTAFRRGYWYRHDRTWTVTASIAWMFGV